MPDEPKINGFPFVRVDKIENAINIREVEILPLPPHVMYWNGPCVCAICGHEWRAVVTIGTTDKRPIVPLECPNCGNMTGGPDA